MAIHGDALSGVNRCSSGNVDFQTSLLHPEPQPAPGPQPRREEGGKTPSTPSQPEPGGHAALRCPEAAEPGLGVPRRALTAPRCSEGPGWGALRLPGALRSSLDPAKSPRDGCGQLINSKGSELDISWLLSLCLIVSAGGGRGSRGYAGDGDVDKKGAGGPTELAFIAFAIALWLARPAWFPQGRPPCRRAGCPAVWSTLRHLGCARDRFKGPEGAWSPSRGQRTFVAQPKGSPVGAQLGGEGFISRQWKGGDLSKAGARGAQGPATLHFSRALSWPEVMKTSDSRACPESSSPGH